MTQIRHRLTTEEIVDIYFARENGRSYKDIHKKYPLNGPSVVQTVSKTIGKYMEGEGQRSMERISKTYVAAAKIIKKRESDGGEVSIPKAPTLSTDMLVTIFTKRQEGQSARVIANLLGWTEEGSTAQVHTIFRMLGLYLAPNCYDDIRDKQQIYKEAREIILQKYPQAAQKVGLYLKHDKESGLLIGCPGIFDEEETEMEEPIEKTRQEELNDAFKGLRSAIKTYILEEVKEQAEREPGLSQEITEALHPQKAKATYPPEIDDDGQKGYYLDDIHAYLGKNAGLFDLWYKNKLGGILGGKFYVLKEDFDKYLFDK